MSAVLSDDGRYRYVLRRVVAPLTGDDLVTFVMLNPSTADAERDDPTIRRCIGFARAFGFRDLSVVNLFAWRATDPSELRALGVNADGPENDRYIQQECSAARAIVVAWGAPSFSIGRRIERLRAMTAGRQLYALGLTKDGHPRHPLYVYRDAQLVEWKP